VDADIQFGHGKVIAIQPHRRLASADFSSVNLDLTEPDYFLTTSKALLLKIRSRIIHRADRS